MSFYLFNPHNNIIPFLEQILNKNLGNIDFELNPFFVALAMKENEGFDILSQAF